MAEAGSNGDRVSVRGLATGLVLMGVFTLTWGCWTIQGFGTAAVLSVAVSSALAALFLVAGIGSLHALRRAPAARDEEVAAGSSATRRRLGLVVLAEAATIFAASTLLGATGHGRYLDPVIALVVGLHFLALVPVFPTQRTVNLVTGTVLSIAAVGAVLVLADRLLGTDLVWSCVALVAAGCTSAQGLTMLVAQRRMRAGRSVGISSVPPGSPHLVPRRRRSISHQRLLVVTVLALVLLGALTLVRPLRVVAPQVFGLHCRGVVCVDSDDRAAVAQALFDNAFAADERVLGPAPEPAHVVFCSTASCYARFGSDRSTARTVGQLGIVIGPDGWQDFYVRHELVHYWQGYRLGLLWRWRTPRWLVEGMAYTLSDDPRPVLVEPNQTYRAKFRTWYARVGPAGLWSAARSAR